MFSQKYLKNELQQKFAKQLAILVKLKPAILIAPTLLKRELEPVVNIEEGELLILAGLSKDQRTIPGRTSNLWMHCCCDLHQAQQSQKRTSPSQAIALN